MNRAIRKIFIAPIGALLLCASLAPAQSKSGAAGEGKAPESQNFAALKNRIEAQVRRLFALGPSYAVACKEPKDSPLPGMLQMEVEVTYEGQSDSVLFHVTRDGRYLLRGDLIDTATDPFAANRALLKTEGAPSKGPANAPVTLVAFSDFQCPTCRALHYTLRSILPLYPQVRFVFKDFALTQIHPWAEIAHKAARCAYRQSPEAFWKMHDMIFERQESITPSNAYDHLLDFARQAEADLNLLKLCMAAPETLQEINASFQQGVALKVANTPTVFINGRRIVGADRNAIEQYIQYELSSAARQAAPATKRPAPQP
jgi:protein-disulfide isomerase